VVLLVAGEVVVVNVDDQGRGFSEFGREVVLSEAAIDEELEGLSRLNR